MYGPPPVMPPAPPARPPAQDGDAAPLGRRAGAWAIDFAVMAGVAVLLGSFTYGRLHSLLTDGLLGKAPGVVFGLFTSGGDVEKAGRELGVSVWNTMVRDIEQAFVLLIVIEFAYLAAALAWKGRTLGKALTDLQVRPASGARSGLGASRSLRRAAVTTLTSTGLYSAAWILLLEGRFVLAVLVWAIAVAVFLANVGPMVGTARRSVADVLGSTLVVRTLSHQKAAALALDGAQVAAQAAREQAGRLAQHERVQQALAADRARQAQELGRRGAEQARRAMDSERGQQAQELGRRMGGRLKNAYENRRAPQDPGPTALPPPPPPGPPPPGYGGPPYQPPPG